MIDVEDLGVELGCERVLDSISFRVQPGEVFGVIGPNGAGKTTLLKAIDGVIAPAQGTITVDGDGVDSLPSRELARRIAVLSQSTDVRFDFSVRDIVAMGRTPYAGRLRTRDPGARQVVERALERTAIDGLADRPITAVSGGERQRVLIARAIAQETPALLLDEPTASLDINYQIATFELVRQLAGDGKAIVAAIHDLDLAARYCDRLMLLADGRPIAVGSPEEVLVAGRIRTAYGTDAAVRRDPVTDAVTVTPLADVPSDPGIRIHVVGHGGAAGRICRELHRAGYAVSVGIVREGGPDHVVADALDLPSVTLPPAAPIDHETEEQHRQMIEEAAATVVTPFHLGPFHRGLLRSTEAARRAVVLDDPPVDERNFDGETGREQWDRATARFPTVTRWELLERLPELLESAEDSNPEGARPAVTDGSGTDREI